MQAQADQWIPASQAAREARLLLSFVRMQFAKWVADGTIEVSGQGKLTRYRLTRK